MLDHLPNLLSRPVDPTWSLVASLIVGLAGLFITWLISQKKGRRK